MLLPAGADMGDLLGVAVTNGHRLNMCVISLDAAQQYFERMGQ